MFLSFCYTLGVLDESRELRITHSIYYMYEIQEVFPMTKEKQMFCFQCEQTAMGTGCTGCAGVCGKSAVEVLESGEKVPAKVEPLPVDETTPCFRNIHVKNLVCAGARRALFFNGIPEMPIDGIVLEDIDITSKLGAEFIYSKNISMKNVNIRNTEGEKIVTRYCEGVEE